MATDMIPARIHLWLAEPGTVMPADESAAPGAGWRDVGKTTEDGTSVVVTPNFIKVRSHQSDYPTKIYKNAEEMAADLMLQAFSGANLKAALGGGTLATVTAGHFKYTPPGSSSSAPCAALLDVLSDEGYKYRLGLVKAYASSPVTVPLKKTEEAKLPLHLEVLGGDTGDPWFLMTDDPDFEPEA